VSNNNSLNNTNKKITESISPSYVNATQLTGTNSPSKQHSPVFQHSDIETKDCMLD
jgi:hypothetical protein